MVDANFQAFAVMAAALVLSPGASMAVVTKTALERGRFAALLTVAGVNLANTSLALASMLGLAAALHQWPSLLRGVSFCGAVYLTCLGLRTLGRMARARGNTGPDPPPEASWNKSSAVVCGMLTNFTNPSVILFYLLLLPQFIRGTDPFFQRFLVLAGTHVSMSLLWLSVYAMAVGTLSERLARPGVRLAMESLTGAVLVILGVRLVL
jgi:threonine/homoserine/homoserine lactone efflux protein